VLLKRKSLEVIVLLFVALIFGGGGSGAGIANLIVQLTALALIGVNPQAFIAFFRQAPRSVVILVVVTLFLPLAQSIPLPPWIWQSLPGRDLAKEGLSLVGHDGIWFPLSLEIHRTLIAFLSLIPPLTVLVLSWDLPPAQKRKLLLCVVLAGAVVVVLGTQQLLTGNRNLVFYTEALGTGDLHATFANRNSAGIFLDLALCALIAVYPSNKRNLKLLLGACALGALFIIGLMLTRSRSSIALGLVPAALFAFRLLKLRVRDKFTARTVFAIIAGLLLAASGGFILSQKNQRIRHSIARFESFRDPRPLIWEDTLVAVKRYWPIGSGIGTFDEVIQVDESLENLQPARSARAHNDYLEAALESGVAGIVLVAAWAGLLVARGARAVRSDRLGAGAIAVFALLALQSLSDYPLRSQTLLCLAGLMLALMIHSPASEKDGRPEAEK
jgi:O-antigen ligase